MKIPVAEIFGPTLGGEATLAGRRTMFLRLGGCDGPGGITKADNISPHCRWCDEMKAVDPKYRAQWRMLDAGEIVRELEALAAPTHTHNLTISGGNPALYDLEDLMYLLRDEWIVNVETQGTVYRKWLARCNSVTCSPKPPSSGANPEAVISRFIDYFLFNLIEEASKPYYDFFPRIVLKVVVDPDGDADYEFAKKIIQDFSSQLEPTYLPWDTYLSVLTPLWVEQLTINGRTGYLRGRWQALAERVLKDPDIGDISVLPQLHKIVGVQ